MNKQSKYFSRFRESALETNLIEVLNYLYSYKVFVLIASIGSAAVVGIWTFFFTISQYTSSAVVTYNYAATNPFENESGSYWSQQSEIDNKMNTIGVFTGSNRFKTALAKEVVGETRLTEKYEESTVMKTTILENIGFSGSVEEFGKVLSGYLEIVVDKPARLVRVNSYSRSPWLSQALANLAAMTLVELNFNLLLKELNSVTVFIEDQTEITKVRLYALEDQLARIQSTEKVLSVMDTSSGLDALQREHYSLLAKLNIERETNEIFIKETERSLAEFKKALESGADSRFYLSQLQQRLDLLLYQKSLNAGQRAIATTAEAQEIETSLSQALDEFQTAMKRLQESQVTSDPWKYLAELEEALVKTKQNTLSTTAKIKALEKQNDRDLKKYDVLPDVLKKISQIKRNIQVTGDLYQQLKAKLQETQIKKAAKVNDLDLLRTADAGHLMGLTVWKRYIFGFWGGACILIMLLTLRYVLLPTIRGRSDLKSLGIEVLGELPFARVDGKNEVRVDAPLIMKWDLHCEEAHAIRQVRFNLQEKLDLHSVKGKKHTKIITVCSASSGEGKTFVSTNLAYALSLAHFRVLFLDLDGVKSTAKQYFSEAAKVEPALSSSDRRFPFAQFSINDCLDLADLSGAREAPLDMLETPIFAQYIDSVKSRYDIIIIDTPPLRNSVEALIASRASDAIIYVANQRFSLRHDVFKTFEILQESYDKRAFGVLNCSYDELNASRRRKLTA